jgi:hypothetical protein
VEAFDEDEEHLLNGDEGLNALRRAIDELLPTEAQATALAERRPGWRWLVSHGPVTARGTARPMGTLVRRRRAA